MAETAQMTLTGDETDEERAVPGTLQYCPTCEEHVLRSREHPHTLSETKEDAQGEQNDGTSGNSASSSSEKDEDDEPEPVGRWYTVRMNYNMVCSTRVAAHDEQHAKQLAEEKKRKEGLEFTDGHHVHTDVDRGSTIYEDDDAAEENNSHL